jgi:branched-chain amino acid transport system substrate-binding protein
MSWQSTVGLAVPLSGDTDAIGESVARGAEVAIDELDTAVSLRIEDTGGDPERAADVVEGLIADGVPIVGGPISSDVGLAVRDVCEEREVPHLPAMCGNPDLTRAGTDYTFRFSSSNRQSAEGSLRFFAGEGVDRVAVVGADHSYPHAVVRHMREYAPEFGIEVGTVEHVPLGTTDFGEQLDAVDADRTGGLFLPYPGNNATTLIREIREREAFDDCVVLGDYSYGSAPYHAELGETILGTHNWAVDTIGEANRRLTRALDEPAGVYHFFGYDVARMAVDALERAGSTDPKVVRGAVADTDYDAASGWGVRFGEDGVNERYQMQVNRWTDLNDGDRRNLPLFRSDRIVPEK